MTLLQEEEKKEELASCSSSSSIPFTMRAAVVKGDGDDFDELIKVVENIPVPRYDTKKQNRHGWWGSWIGRGSCNHYKNTVLIRTHAVALDPADVQVISGRTRAVQGPPSFPYIPGGDVAGVVVQVPPSHSSSSHFQVGDRIAARSYEAGPRGALGAYARVSTQLAVKLPTHLNFNDAAALVSAAPATLLFDDTIGGLDYTANKRILVLGASGGVGSHLVQLLKGVGHAQLVVGTARVPQFLTSKRTRTKENQQQQQQVLPPLCDRAIDYNLEDVFRLPEFQNDPFDLIVDLAHGNGYDRLQQETTIITKQNQQQLSIVKPASQGGRYITTVPPCGPMFELSSFWDAAVRVFGWPSLWRYIVSRTWYRNQLPAYSFACAVPETNHSIQRTFELATTTISSSPAAAAAKHSQSSMSPLLRAVLDARGPFPFTTQGVRDALELQRSRHARGKVVIGMFSS